MSSNHEHADRLLPESVRQTLAALPQVELVQLLCDIAEEGDEFRHALMARLTITPQMIVQQQRASAQVRALTKQIDKFFNEIERRAERGDYGDDDYHHRGYEWDEPYPDLAATFEIAQTLHPRDQMEVYWYILTSADGIEAEMPLGVPQVMDAIINYAVAARGIIQAPEEIVASLKMVVELLDWSFGGEVEEAVHQALSVLCETSEELQHLIAILREMDESRFADWIAEYYRLLGDDEAYLAIRTAHLSNESQYLDLADYWQEQADPAKAQEILESFADRLAEHVITPEGHIRALSVKWKDGVLDRLQAIYCASGDDTNLCRILILTARSRSVTLELYQQIKPLASSLGTWADTHPILLQLARNSEETLARIYLFEEDWDAAITLAQKKSTYFFGNSLGVRPLVACGIKHHRPQAALTILCDIVQSCINQQQRAAYAEAAGYAAEIKDIYRNVMHDEHAWQSYITDIRARYPRHRALQEEFRAL